VRDRLDAIFDRLQRAEEHFEAIKAQLLAYYDSDPCEISGEFDPNAEHPIITRIKVAPLPMRINTLVGEFLHDLRSSLDHLAWQLVEHNGGAPTENTSFPVLKIGPTPNKQGVQPPPTVVGGVSEDAMAIIEDAQPYKWGEHYATHPLWVLHQLWNIDKHRHVLARGSRTDGFTISEDTPAFKFTGRLGKTTKDCAELILVPDDPTVEMDLYTTFEVVIYEPGHGIEGSLLQALEEVRMATLTTITQTEDRCFK
jgi:hypothetical protein